MAKERPTSGQSTSTEERDTDDDGLRCVVCDHRISERAYRSEMSGAHEHTFVNPNGIVHHIGCFVAAPGAAHVGDTQEAFSWFPGWKWQVAICARCYTHVGWIFRCSGDQFHGLILSALR